MGSLIVAAVFVGSFAAIYLIGCAVVSYLDAGKRIEGERIARMVRRTSDGGRYIGGQNKPGSN